MDAFVTAETVESKRKPAKAKPEAKPEPTQAAASSAASSGAAPSKLLPEIFDKLTLVEGTQKKQLEGYKIYNFRVKGRSSFDIVPATKNLPLTVVNDIKFYEDTDVFGKSKGKVEYSGVHATGEQYFERLAVVVQQQPKDIGAYEKPVLDGLLTTTIYESVHISNEAEKRARDFNVAELTNSKVAPLVNVIGIAANTKEKTWRFTLLTKKLKVLERGEGGFDLADEDF